MHLHRTLALVTAAGIALAGLPAASAATSTDLDPATVTVLDAAIHQEAFDWTTYTLFSEAAARSGDTAAADALAAAAATERNDHVVALATELGLVGTNAENLQKAIDGETYEATTMYPEFAATARAEGCEELAIRFERIGSEEWMHAQKYQAALSAITNGTGSIPRAGSLNDVVVEASEPSCAGTQTQANLVTAMKGESTATAKYQLFAAAALASGDARLAELFSGTATVEFREHMSNEAIAYGLLGTTDENLGVAIDRETLEGEVTYPEYAATAAAAGDTSAAELLRSIAADELVLAANLAAVR